MRDDALIILDSPDAEPDVVEEADEQLLLPENAGELTPARIRAWGDTSVRLTAAQRKQVAIWIVDGITNKVIRENLRAFGAPAIGDRSLGFYRRNTELLDEAREYIRAAVSGIGLSDRAVRVRRLQRHADRLERLIDEGGLIETENKVIGWGKQSETIQTRRFAAPLSKEYRATIEQIQKEVEPLQAVVMNQETNIFMALSMDDQRQMIEAAMWRPNMLATLTDLSTDASVQSIALMPPIDAIDGELVE